MRGQLTFPTRQELMRLYSGASLEYRPGVIAKLPYIVRRSTGICTNHYTLCRQHIAAMFLNNWLITYHQACHMLNVIRVLEYAQIQKTLREMNQ